VIVGAGAVFETVRLRLFDTLLFGFSSVIVNVRVDESSEARIAASRWLLSMNVVTRLALFTRTIAVLAKFWPVTWSVNAPLPVSTLAVLSELSVGEFGRTPNVTAPETPPPLGFATTTLSVVGVATSVLIRVTVSWPLPTKVVGRWHC